MFSYRLAIALIGIVALAGCKVIIKTPKEGYVKSESNSFVCAAESVCQIDVVDIFFDETFVGIPKDGNYRFKEWRKAPYFFCGGYDKPCPLTTTGFRPYEALMAFLESDERFYLEPVFEVVASKPPPAQSNVPQHIVKYTGLPYIVDATGKAIGEIVRRNDRNGWNEVRVNFLNDSQDYLIFIDGVSGKLTAYGNLVFALPYCDESGGVYGGGSRLLPGPDGYFWMGDLTSFGVEVKTGSHYLHYTPDGGRCDAYKTTFSGLLPAIKTNLRITWPLHKVYPN